MSTGVLLNFCNLDLFVVEDDGETRGLHVTKGGRSRPVLLLPGPHAQVAGEPIPAEPGLGGREVREGLVQGGFPHLMEPLYPTLAGLSTRVLLNFRNLIQVQNESDPYQYGSRTKRTFWTS